MSLTKSLRRLALALIVLALSLCSLPASAASVNSFYFTDFTGDYYLSRDADHVSHLRVVETLTAVFPDSNQNHGIDRIIPTTNNGGANYTVSDPTTFRATVTRNGTTEPVSYTVGQDYVSLRIGDANRYVHGTQTYVLEYEFSHVILDFNDYQELYWDTNGTGWSQSFDHLTANLHLDSALLADWQKNTYSCYVGPYGATNNNGASTTDACTVQATSDGLTFTAANLKAGWNLTFATAFAAETFDATVYTLPPNVLPLILLIIQAVSLILVFLLIRFLLCPTGLEHRRYYKGLFAAPQYTPPKALTIAEAIALHPNLSENLTAIFLELTVTNKITLIQGSKKTLSKHYNWSVRLNSVDNLTTAQTNLLKILAGSSAALVAGQEFQLTSHQYSNTLASLKRDITPSSARLLKQKGYLVSGRPHPGATLAVVAWSAYSCLAVFLTLRLYSTSAEILGGGALVVASFLLGLAGLVILASLAHQLQLYAARTTKGLDTMNYLDGLRDYITLAEKDRIAFLQSVKGVDTSPAGLVKLYEPLLPYAAAFGVESSWLQELSHYYEVEPDLAPDWYSVSTGVFIARDLNRALTSVNNNIANAVSSSSTSSSSSSGSGGGGFSGGGGGGGGGGGW